MQQDWQSKHMQWHQIELQAYKSCYTTSHHCCTYSAIIYTFNLIKTKYKIIYLLLVNTYTVPSMTRASPVELSWAPQLWLLQTLLHLIIFSGDLQRAFQSCSLFWYKKTKINVIIVFLTVHFLWIHFTSINCKPTYTTHEIWSTFCEDKKIPFIILKCFFNTFSYL